MRVGGFDSRAAPDLGQNGALWHRRACQARIAGVLYLTIIVVGGFGYLSGSSLIVPGDAAGTASNLLASESLWRLGLAALLVMLLCDLGVAVLFYVLLAPVGRSAALLGMTLRIAQTAVQAVALLARYAPLLVLKDAAAAAFAADQRRALAVLSVKLFEQGFTLGLVFFGAHCLVIGWLIVRSSFLPRILGALMLVAGACYLVNCFAELVAPTLAMPEYLLFPAYLAELALALWLVVAGVNEERWTGQSTRS